MGRKKTEPEGYRQKYGWPCPEEARGIKISEILTMMAEFKISYEEYTKHRLEYIGRAKQKGVI